MHTVCGILMHSSLAVTLDGLPAWARCDQVLDGRCRIDVRDNQGNPEEAVLDLKYRRITVLPPIGNQKRYPALVLTVLHATERSKPKNRKRIEWKLITDLPVRSRADAVEKLKWYAMRWKIEMFHKILKSGCKAEEVKLRTASRLVNLIAVFCIMSWRVFFITMVNRSAPSMPAKSALTDVEIALLDHLVKDKAHVRSKTISNYLTKIAKLGGTSPVPVIRRQATWSCGEGWFA
jgi:hypothetical protein